MFYIGPISSLTLFWLILIIAFIVAELMTAGLATIWFAGGAVVAAILSAMEAPVYMQIILFIVVSAVLMAAIRPIAVKYFNPERTKTNVDAVIGKQGVVTARIDNAAQEGSVKVDGMTWSARALIHQQVIEEGALVSVRKVEGVKLIVEPEAGQQQGGTV